MPRRIIVGLLLLSLTLTAAAVYVVTRFQGPPEHRALELVPSELAFYLDIFVDPSTDQKVALRSLNEVTGDVKGTTDSALDELLRLYGLDPEEVRPWLGREVAMFGLPYQRGHALILEVAGVGPDEDLPAEVTDTLPDEHRFAKGFVAVGDETHLQSFAPERPLAASDRLKDAIGSFYPDDRIMFGIATRDARFLDLVRKVAPMLQLPFRLMDGLTSWTLSADDGRLIVDGYAASDGAALYPDREPPHMGGLPANAWLAGEIINTDHTVEALFDMVLPGRARDSEIGPPFDLLLNELDGSRFSLGGSAPLNLEVSLDMELENRRSAGEALHLIADHIGLGVKGSGPDDLELQAPAPIGSIDVTFDKDLMQVRRRVPPDPGRLEDTDRYREAATWLEPLDVRGYVDMPRAYEVFEPFLGGPDLWVDTSFLEHIGRVAVGVGEEDRFIESRIVIEIE